MLKMVLVLALSRVTSAQHRLLDFSGAVYGMSPSLGDTGVGWNRDLGIGLFDWLMVRKLGSWSGCTEVPQFYAQGTTDRKWEPHLAKEVEGYITGAPQTAEATGSPAATVAAEATGPLI